MTTYKGPDGRTQDVEDFEVVRTEILLRIGWKPVEPALQDASSVEEEMEPPSMFIGRKTTKK